MRYRRLSYRYTLLVRDDPTWTATDTWYGERTALPSLPRWRPETDVYETTGTVEILVDLAGVAPDDIEVQLFDDGVIVEGHRQLPPSETSAVFHAARIRQGPFRAALPLPAHVDSGRIHATYENGILRLTLPKVSE